MALGGIPAALPAASAVSRPPEGIPSPPVVVEMAPELGASQGSDAEVMVEFVDIGGFDETGEPTGEVLPADDFGLRSAVPGRPQVQVALASAPTTAMELFTEAVVFAKYGLTDKAISHLHRVIGLEPAHEAAQELLKSLGGGELTEVEFGPAVLVPTPVALEPDAPFTFDAASALEPAPLVVPPLSPSQPATVEAGAPAPNPAPAAPDLLAILMDRPLADPAPAPRPSVAHVRLENLEAMLGLAESGPRPSRLAASRSLKPSIEEQIGLDLAGPLEPRRRAEIPALPLEWILDSRSFQLPGLKRESVEPAPSVLGPADPDVSAASGVTFPTGSAESPEEPVELLEVTGMLGGPPDEHLREIDFFLEQGLLDEAARQLGRLREQFPDNAEVNSRQALLKARGWEDGAPPGVAEASAAELFSEEEQFFDLAAELEKELAEDELVAEARGGEPSSEVSIEELFKEFQRGVAEQIHEEDYDTHFNLGLAYREMGLLDEAIGEFQLASKSPSLFIEAASMIGASYLDKGLPEQAAEWYARALTAPDMPAETEVGLKYELGRAHEAAGNLSAALANFAEVLALNPGFRDVVERVTRLQMTH